MLALLMIQLQSFSRLALVFVTAPLGLIGATGALLLSNRPFGFVALLGLIALAGMIMRNTVILVDQIDRDIAAGHDPLPRRHRRHRAPRPAGGADCARRDPRHDPARRQRVLGPDGDHHHGRPVRGDGADVLVVPALYAMWFRVRADEPAGTAQPELPHQPEWDAPFGIAAE